MSKPPLTVDDAAWQAACAANGLDPQQRLQARQQLLGHPDSLDCCLYRPDEEDADAEELDLGDARVLLQGQFQPPADWDEQTCEDYFDDSDPADFVAALLEPCAAPGTRQHFRPQPGDYVAVSEADGRVQMYYLYECLEQDDGLHCVLIREHDEL